jgi:plastocyanin
MDTRFTVRRLALSPAICALAVALLLLAACGGSGAGGANPYGGSPVGGTAAASPSATSPAATATTAPATGPQQAVQIGGAFGNFKFEPATLTVPVGTTVTWTNTTGAPHTVTSDTGAPAAFDSGAINTGGGTFSFTFTKAGTYNYHCSFHPYMHATIVVTG